MTARLVQQAEWLGEFLNPHPRIARYLRAIRQAGHFDRTFYRGANPGLHPLFRAFPERHYVVFGEREGRQPNPEFSPRAYIRHNPDLTGWAARPYLHFLLYGRRENRLTRDLPSGRMTDNRPAPVLRPRTGERAPVAVVVHVYYHDLWPEIAGHLAALDMPFDLFVTVTDTGGGAAEALAEDIRAAFPGALAVPMPNRGRDIFPFVHLVNAGLLDGYRAVAKIHTKRSPHRTDGDDWRRSLIGGVLPGAGTARRLAAFLADDDAGVWVADGQHYRDPAWWGTNFDITAWLLRRIEIRAVRETLAFPAGSMYWLKPVMIAMIRGLELEQTLFETECGQVDGTLAHAFERALGAIATASGLTVRESTEIIERARPTPRPPRKARYVSAFYLPQFHRLAENDAWWGRGYTEWQAAARARPMFDGHAQPALPSELGFYDLRQTEVMGEQAALAQGAGIDAFCVYHYWFGGRWTVCCAERMSPSPSTCAGPTRAGAATGTGCRAKRWWNRPMPPDLKRGSPFPACPTCVMPAISALTVNGRGSSSTGRRTCPTRCAMSPACAPPGRRWGSGRSNWARYGSMLRANRPCRRTSSTSGWKCRPMASCRARIFFTADHRGTGWCRGPCPVFAG